TYWTFLRAIHTPISFSATGAYAYEAKILTSGRRWCRSLSICLSYLLKGGGIGCFSPAHAMNIASSKATEHTQAETFDRFQHAFTGAFVMQDFGLGENEWAY
ncbi:MAG: hypothetical protein AAGM45_18830, partial [Cyanobacteria bacterium J06588_5]